VATRDFLRSELTRFIDELGEIGGDAKAGGDRTVRTVDGRKETALRGAGGQQGRARRRQKTDRKATRRAQQAPTDEPDDETSSDAPYTG
jgi:hypothetical protein